MWTACRLPVQVPFCFSATSWTFWTSAAEGPCSTSLRTSASEAAIIFSTFSGAHPKLIVVVL
jgi:hypothetical protein